MSQQLNKVHLIDCMDFMRQVPKGYYDLAICDPPYFNGPENLGYYGARQSKTGIYRGEYKKIGIWTIPNNLYYQELCRVSKHQIIWGINYFNKFENVTVGRIIWDKIKDQSTFSKCEIASCSLIDSVQIYRFLWNGMQQGKSNDGTKQEGNKKKNEIKIHPTQKPVALYKWLLQNYAKPGWKIFDSHVGSRSLGIACYDMGFYFEGCELDIDYFNDQEERFKNHIANQELFDKAEIQQAIYENKLLL